MFKIKFLATVLAVWTSICGAQAQDFKLKDVRITGDTSVVQAKAGETDLMFRQHLEL